MDLDERLRAAGHRVTTPRRLVWQILDEHGHEHLTANEVYERAHAQEQSVNLSSVYRSLALLTDLGLARETSIGTDGTVRWEAAHEVEQVHLVCTVCGGIEHHPSESVTGLLHHLRADHRFEPAEVEVQVTGRCRRCSTAPPPESGQALPPDSRPAPPG